MTPNPDHMYNKRLPSPENAILFIGDGTELVVEYVGSVDFIFHSTEDVRVTLESVLFIPSLKINLLSLHTIQAKEAITLDAAGTHLMGGRLFSPKDRAGSRLKATRRSPALFFSLPPKPAVQPVRTPGVSSMPPSPGVMVAGEGTMVAGFPPFRPMHGLPGKPPSPYFI